MGDVSINLFISFFKIFKITLAGDLSFLGKANSISKYLDTF